MHRILLVEDSSDIRMLIKRGFALNESAKDWDVIEAADGEEALDIINSQRIRLVITDLVMPNMDGRELVKKIKSNEDFKDLPIIVLSVADELEIDLLELGAVDFYRKPITDFKPLIAKVKTHIENFLHVTNLKRTVSFSRLNHDLENIDETMQQCLTDFCLQMHADFGILLVPDDSGKPVRYASFNFSNHMLDLLSGFLLDDKNPVVVKLREMREGLSIKSIYNFDSKYPECTQTAREYGVKSILLLPLKRGDRQTGILVFLFRKPRSHNHEAIESLTTSISEMAYAVANAQQLKLLKDRIHDLWRESHIPVKALQLPECISGDCDDECGKCGFGNNFKVENVQDIILLTRGLMNRVGHYVKVEQKRAEDLEQIVTQRTVQLEEEKNKAQKTSSMKSEFLASMSHELRSPLNSIIGFAERIPSKINKLYAGMDMLASQLNGDRHEDAYRRIISMLNTMRSKELNTISEFCGYIRDSGSHLLGLINDILDLSKIEAGKLELTVESLDFRLNVESVMASFRNMAEEKELAVVTDIGDVPAKGVMADTKRFNQILFNLVGNAIKFSNPGGAVKLSAKERFTENEVEFCISDTGPGIPVEFQKHIFNRFEQADRSGVLPGAGLGLAIAKKLVEVLGGSIWFESEPGKGSRFYFTLPTKNVCEVK